MAKTFAALWLLLGLGCFPNTECWDAPAFCHDRECPMYTVVKQYEGFEERKYNMSSWITTDIPSTNENDVTAGIWRLYNFNQGQNSKKKMITMSRPVLLSIKEADSVSEKQVSISVYQADPNIPDPTDATIRKIVRPGGIIYVRVFGGIVSEADALNNLQKLRTDLKAAGKAFIENRFDGAGYEAPWELINRHNEVWVSAA